MQKSNFGESKSYKDRDDPGSKRLISRFTNRVSILKKFKEHLNEEPPHPILHYYGVGGVGKTFLLRHIQSEYCFKKHFPCAYINFRSGDTVGTIDSLLGIKLQLRDRGVKFSTNRFGFILSKYFERRYNIINEKDAELLPEEVSTIAKFFADSIPFGSSSFELINKKGGDILEYFKERRIKKWVCKNVNKDKDLEFGERINSIKLGDFEHVLTKAFAADLHEASLELDKQSNHIIIFFDTYENLQNKLSELHGKREYSFVQILCEELLQFKANVLVLTAGKNKLRWNKIRIDDGSWKINPNSRWAQTTDHKSASNFKFIKQYLIGRLSKKDSLQYLIEVRGVNRELAQKSYELAGGFPLGLAAMADLIKELNGDITKEIAVLQSKTSGLKPFSEKWINAFIGWLLESLLANTKELEELIYKAAIPRSFNIDLCYHLFNKYNSEKLYHQLLNFSFISSKDTISNEKRDDLFTYHATIRRLLLRNLINSRRRHYHDWNIKCIEYFKSKIDNINSNPHQKFVYKIELLYHKASIDPEQTLPDFKKIFNLELDKFNLSRCEFILDAISDQLNWSNQQEAQILTLQGRLFLAKAKYEAALDKFIASEKIEPLGSNESNFSIENAQNLAECYRLLGNYSESLRIFGEIKNIGIQSNNIILRGIAKWGLSLTNKLLDNVSEALTQSDELLQCVENEENRFKEQDLHKYGITSINKKIAHLHRHRAVLFRYAGDFKNSFDSCQRFSSYYGSESDSTAYYYKLLILSHLFRMERNFDRANSKADDAYKGFKEIKEPRGRLTAIRSLGQIAYDRGDDLEAKEDFKKIKNCSSKTYPYGPIYGHLGMGELNRLSENFSKAKDHYLEASKLCHELGGKVEVAYANLGLAEIARVKNNKKNVLSKVIESDDISESSGHPWIGVYANLLGAIVANRDAFFFEKAVEASKHFKRRECDQNHEMQKIIFTKQCLKNNKPVPPFRFNFL